MQRVQEPDRQPQPDTSKFQHADRPDAAPVKGARRTVLRVSGDAGQAMDCAAFLQGIGFDVVPVKSVPMGAARLAEWAPLWSAIVLDADSIGADIATGNLRGWRRLAPQVPVILMTSDAGKAILPRQRWAHRTRRCASRSAFTILNWACRWLPTSAEATSRCAGSSPCQIRPQRHDAGRVQRLDRIVAALDVVDVRPCRARPAPPASAPDRR